MLQSCDTTVALNSATADGSLIFGKNSDRQINEAQNIVFIPCQDHKPDDKIQCTYMKIPQVSHTYSVILSQPYWMWGAEMGVNEHGVVIGNEAIFTNQWTNYVTKNTDVLLGMDILRLTLERSKDANEALDILTSLHETYDQGGNAGHKPDTFYYHNSYIIADWNTAWIVETAGRDWVALKVDNRLNDIASISNIAKLNSWDKASKGVQQRGNNSSSQSSSVDCCPQFKFAEKSNDWLYSFFGDGNSRQCRSYEMLLQKKGKLDATDFMEILRDHKSCKSLNWTPTSALHGADICMHSGFGPIRKSRTSNSFIVKLTPKKEIIVWTTATGTPCTSVFKPFYFSSFSEMSDLYSSQLSGSDCDINKLWWKHEVINRIISLDYPNLIQVIQQDQQMLESKFKQIAHQMETASNSEKTELASKCFQEALQQEDIWLDKLKKVNDQMWSTAPLYYLWYLSSCNAMCNSKEMKVQRNPKREFLVILFIILILMWI